MISVETNREILKVKNTMFFGFEKNQIISIFAALPLAALIFIFVPWIYPLKALVVVITCGISVSAGFIRPNNISMVKFVGKVIKSLRMMNKPILFKGEDNYNQERGRK